MRKPLLSRRKATDLRLLNNIFGAPQIFLLSPDWGPDFPRERRTDHRTGWGVSRFPNTHQPPCDQQVPLVR